MSDDGSTALKTFAAGGDSVLQFSVTNEQLQLVSSAQCASLSDKLASFRDSQEPRFALFRHNSKVVFLYFCPESVPVRQRMLYSSCRTAMLQHVVDAGVTTVDRKLEIMSREDLKLEAI